MPLKQRFVAYFADDLRCRLSAVIRVARGIMRQLGVGERSTALQASASDYRALVERSIQGLSIHQQRRIQLANPALAAIFGYASPEALIGQDYATLIAPHERDRIESYRTACLQGQPAPDRLEYQGLRQDGTFVWIECLVSRITWRGAPAILTTLQDITARRQAAEALRESEARHRLLADNATDIIWVRDAHLRLLYITPSVTRVRGYSVAEAMAQSPEETLTPASFAAARQAWERWLQLQRRAPGTAPSMITLELEALCKDGSTVWLENRTSILRDATGRVTGFVGVNRDMTARKQAEEALQRAYAEMEARVQERTAALQQANSALRAEIAERQRTEDERQRLAAQLQQTQKLEALGTLAGGIAHDFNNILTAILGYAALTLDDVPHESQTWHHLQSVLTAGQRAKDLVQQILTFSRHGSLERRPLQLDLLVREVLGLLRASLPTTIEIRSRLATDTGTVLANPSQMHQVLLNLCTNAEHAMRETGGVLEVRLEAVEIDQTLGTHHMALPPGPYVQLTICDTGHGMAPDVLDRIFEPFFTTKDVGAGTGLGLSVVHGIIAEHRGAISVRSVAGQGTTCSITLPCLQHSTEEMPQDIVSVPHGQGCILVVDDEAPLARLSQTMLERLGYDVVAHTSSVEALAAFQAQPQHFDAVMTDQTMPHLTGEQLAQELRRIRPDVPIVLCTGFSHVMDADKARALGIDAFCLKPFDARDLERVLAQVMTKSLVQHS